MKEPCVILILLDYNMEVKKKGNTEVFPYSGIVSIETIKETQTDYN